MTDQPLTGVSFGRAAPTVAVSDMPRAISFYTETLGMQLTFSNGSPVGFAILRRDAAELHLTLARGHRGSTSNVAHILVSDADALYRHLEAAGVRIVKSLRTVTEGVRGFVFADPDGNRIDVGEQLR